MGFTVVIPTFNRAAILPRAIRSVLAQTYEQLELVIVDDGSDDDTSSVVNAFDDRRVRYVRRANGGVSSARNAGAEQATGEFLVFLDSDDELMPEALQRFSERIDAHDLVVCGVVKVSPDRRRWRTVTPDREHVLARGFSPLLAGGFAIRASLFRACTGYDETLRYSENTELAWRLREHVLRQRAIEVIEQPLTIVYNQPERAHDRSRYDAARHIIERRSYEMEADPDDATTRREFRANYLAIAAVSAARIGRRRDALALAARAVALEPTSRSRYRTLASVTRTLALGRAARPRPSTTAPTAPAPPAPASGPGLVHAVVVTYERPELLRRTLAKLATTAVTSVTIVDNAPSPESRAAAASVPPPLRSAYLPMPANGGPAGGLAAGMTRILESCADDDWILVLNDDGMPGSDTTVGHLHEFGEWLVDHGATVGAVGIAGSRFDPRSGRLRRPADRELFGPVTVDLVAGNQLLTIRAAAARVAGTFDPELFFGFEELDYCLRLQRSGFGIFVDGPSARVQRDRHGRLGDSVGPAPRTTNSWRRYYSVRNRIVIMRRYSNTRRALAVTLAELFGRPAADITKRREHRVALLASGTRGIVDAWRGRLGARVQPFAD